MHRDLTLRTRGKKPQPLFSLDDIRKLIRRGDVKLHVAPDAVKCERPAEPLLTRALSWRAC